MDLDVDVGSTERGNALVQLCGEILLHTTPTRPPTIARSNAAVGLEVLDLLLNPDHILRVTEELTLRNTLMLERRVRLDVALDGLSRQQEEGATQLSALVSGRVGLDEADGDRELLWLPLDTVPRPIAVGVTVVDASGLAVPRPPQRAVRHALAAALGHILHESIRADPRFEASQAGRSGNPPEWDRTRTEARWLLEASVLSVCALAATSHRSDRRLKTGAAELLTHPRPALESLIEGERRPAHKRALEMVRDALCDDDPFLELLRLVHSQYFVVAGLDRASRHHLVHYDLPEAEAAPESTIRRLGRRSLVDLDPRQHNFSFHVRVPLPDNISEYNLWVQSSPEGEAAAPYDVSLVGTIGFDDHPARNALDALETCAADLDRTLAADGLDCDEGAEFKLAYLLTRASPILDRLDAIVDRQERAADVLVAHADGAPHVKMQQILSNLRGVIDEARRRLSDVRRRLEQLDQLALVAPVGGNDPPSDAAANEQTTADLVAIARRAVEHDLLGRQLVSSPLTGQEIGRLVLRRTTLAPPSRPRARWLDLWVTVSNESRPYASGAIVPPLGLALLLFLVGVLLFNAASWPIHVPDLAPATVAGRQADAIVAVLLLIPGFALSRFEQPDHWSVSARLHRPGHLFVLLTIMTLGATSVVVATQVGSSTDAPVHEWVVLWTFRGAFYAFLLGAFWASVAALLRSSHSWRPKGLRWLHGEVDHGAFRSALFNPARYRAKPTDAAFDLTLPGSGAGRARSGS